MARVEGGVLDGGAILVRAAYIAFEIAAFMLLAGVAVIAFYDLAVYIARHGFNYAEVLARILLIFVFIDLMRVIVNSVTERRFRMDILFEAITIAIARDLISSLAIIEENFDPLRIGTLAGLLALTVGLWYVTRRAEIRPRPSEREEAPRGAARETTRPKQAGC